MHVYVIRCVTTGKVYVGSTCNFERRRREHYSRLRRGCSDTATLQNAWNKYGEDAFVFELMETLPAATDGELCAREGYWIAKFEETVGVFNINKSPEAPPFRGKKMPEGTGAKIAAKLRGRKTSREIVEKVAASNRGRKRSPEACRRISEALRRHYDSIALYDHPRQRKSLHKAVLATNMCSGEQRTYPSIGATARDGFNPRRVSDVMRGTDGRKQHKGWTFTALPPIHAELFPAS